VENGGWYLVGDELIFSDNSSQPENITLNDTSLFSGEGIWTLPVTEYLSEFLAPLPKANYATVTMVVSTAGLWTDARNSSVSYPSKFPLGSKKRKERRAVVRAYLPESFWSLWLP